MTMLGKHTGTQPSFGTVSDIPVRISKDINRSRVPMSLEDKPFIAWDGEGAQEAHNPNSPQRYVLLGCSTGERITGESLSTSACLAFIIAVGRRNPNATHIGFAFDYDTNMILRGLSARQLRILRDNGSVLVINYRIEHVPNKWLQITEYGPTYKTNKYDKFTVRIQDIFGFFQCSFLKAIKSYIPTHSLMAQLAVIESGKADRNTFTYEKIEYITQYWEVEIQLLHALVEELRRLLYDVDLRINRWHGPGALANFTFRRENILPHKAITPDAVRDAARYGYAGGRFELFRLGRHAGPVYGLDINSAYPAAIARLPSLSEGTWQHVIAPRSISEFGIYHVKLRSHPLSKYPGPLFHRDVSHNITYPWTTEGWYWSPEVRMTMNALGLGEHFDIIEGYEYTGFSTRPFEFVADMYAQRKRLKAQGVGSEKALKLALNSLYGKMAQRVGWERNGKPPVWHQLEWAGYVTSATRAKLYSIICRIPWEDLIAVETDGIYTTATPESLGITHSTKLGEWEIAEYEQILYVQSGVYFAQSKDNSWVGKYRGLDNGTLTNENIAAYLKSLTADSATDWPAITGPTTRFMGYKAALFREDQGRGLAKEHHCVWETEMRDITPGEIGKRAHAPKLCRTCKEGYSAYDKPHDLIIKSKAMNGVMSERHSIPWEDNDNEDAAEWRHYARMNEGML